MLGELLGGLVWITANVAYGPMVRSGERGFRRFAAFWLGWPGTLVSYFVIKPTRRAAEPRVDNRYRTQIELEEERDLLLEIRRDQALRIARRQVRDDGTEQGGDGADDGGDGADDRNDGEDDRDDGADDRNDGAQVEKA